VTIAWEATGGTHVGRLRNGNEDAFRTDAERGIFLVADGMGGHAAGEVASGLAANTVASALAEACDGGARDEAMRDALRQAVLSAHQRIVRFCARRPSTRGMGTTLTACAIDPAGVCRIAHIGDSRLYRLREGRLEQLTVDHTWVQREVDSGRLAPEDARRHPLSHILTRVLTDDPEAPEVDLLTEPVVPGDLLILMTDGLYNMLEDAAIREIVAREDPLPERIRALIDGANRAGGADNITAVLVRIGEG
jgi:serine/threonine protein phosphatase PrpC